MAQISQSLDAFLMFIGDFLPLFKVTPIVKTTKGQK
jgi:hypothetical protein